MFLERLLNFSNALPGVFSLGLIWGIMAIGVYISYKILDIADLTVDGSICTGGWVWAVLLKLWVLKEASVKLTGEGLRGYPNHTDFSPDDPRVMEMDGCYVAVLEG